MASYLGIDIGHSTVRAALIRTSYRRIAIEALGSCELGGGIELPEALKAATSGMMQRCDGVAVALPGEQIFFRRLELPATAAKQLDEVVPFEIEAQIPFDLTDAVFDYRALPREKGAEKIALFSAIARIEDVHGRIALLQGSLNMEPELVVPGAFALASYVANVPELADQPSVCLLDIGASKTEVVVAVKGEVLFARTLSVGTNRLPEGAQQLAREVRQTLSAWRASGGGLIESMYLAGGGSQLGGADAFLASALGVQVLPLPSPKFEGLSDEQAAQVPIYAKSLSLALSLQVRDKLLNLRQGPLTYERGFGFLREKVPVLAGLGVVILVSSLFATWAELRALSADQEVLENALALVSKEILGEEIRDPAQAIELIEQGPAGKDEDPLPQVDAFDVLHQLAEAVGPDLKHDVEELDVQRAGTQATPKVTIHGVVPTVQDAESLAAALKTYPCFQDVKIVKTSQAIGGEGQKYLMDFDLKCASAEVKKAVADAPSAAPASSTKVEKLAVGNWYANLSPRERRLVVAFGVTFAIGVLLLVPFGIDTMLRSRREANAELRDAITKLQAGRASVKNKQLKREQIVARYAKKAPKLGGFLEQLAKENNIEIPEAQDKPEAPIGKKYVERQTTIRLRKVPGLPLLQFFEKIEQSGYPVAVTRLNIRKRGGEHDSYDVEMGVSAYDRNETTAAAAAPAASAEEK